MVVSEIEGQHFLFSAKNEIALGKEKNPEFLLICGMNKGTEILEKSVAIIISDSTEKIKL